MTPPTGGTHLLEVIGAVHDGELRFSWNYLPDRHRETTVARVAAGFVEALHAIARDSAESARRPR